MHNAIVITLHGLVNNNAGGPFSEQSERSPARIKMSCLDAIPMVVRFDPQLSRLANVYSAAVMFARINEYKGELHCGQLSADEYVFVRLDSTNRSEYATI